MTTKNCKTEKIKTDMLEVTVKVWGLMQSVLKKKKKDCTGKDLQKREGFKSGIKDRVGDKKLIIINESGAVTFTHNEV